ncbi:hypothetical protein Tco_1322324 [Tanacetum coccineum]
MSISEDELRTNDDEYESRKEQKRGKELLIQLVNGLFVYPAGRTNRQLMRSKDILSVYSNSGMGVGIQLFVVFNKGGILGLQPERLRGHFNSYAETSSGIDEKLEHGQVAQTVNNKKEKVRKGIEAAFAYPVTLEKGLNMLYSRFMKYMVMLGMAETFRYGFAFYDNNASMYHVTYIVYMGDVPKSDFSMASMLELYVEVVKFDCPSE